MACGWGGGMSGWSPLSFDRWELQSVTQWPLPLGVSRSGEFLESHQLRRGESLLGLWDSQVQVCCSAGQHALQAGQVSQMGWARGSVSMETYSLYLGSSGLGPAACFSSGPSEFTAWSLGANGLLSASHRSGHWVLVLPRKQASDLGSCVFPASAVNYSGLTGGF